ncbi:PAS domain S-box protein, partial [Methanosarcina sp. UBA5]|uniref:PAS domain S-box protein n=1 Tax=Methanosarcina sp. UBA5 TaxID=1915593 RepID=UPI0025F1B9ED
MGSTNRISGIDIIGDIPWGTHFCQFYQTKEDLMDIIIPYFKAGLENNEFCLWVISDQLDEEEAKEALKVAIPEIDAYIKNGQIEIVPYTYWHVEEGTLGPKMVLNQLIEKTNKSLVSGYDGLRYSGNDFCGHDNILDSFIGKYPMMALCTYPIDKYNAVEILDIIANHQFALTKKESKWEKIESSSQKNNKECKQVEAALSMSEKGFCALTTASSEMVYRVSPDWSEMRYFYGRGFLANTESPSSTWIDKYVLPEDQWRVTAIINEAIRTKSTYQTEHRVQLADGSVGWIFSRAVPLLDANGEIVEWFGAASDITKRKEAEAKLKDTLDNLDKLVKERTLELQSAYDSLKKSEGNLAEAQKMAHIGSWERDFANNELHWSDETYRIFGLKPQESKVNSDTFLNYVHPEDRSRVDNAIKEALKGKPFDIDYRIITANGEEHIVYGKAEVVFDEKNNPIRLKGTVQDITEHRKAEEKIRNLANVVESSTEAIITESFEGIITSWNKGAEQVYGYSAEEVLGESISILEPPTLTGETHRLCEIIKRGEKIQQYETLRLRKDGKLINVSLSIFPVFDNKGKTTAASIIATDITRRKEAEERLRESEEKYRNIVETANELILITDNENVITYVNKKMLDMLGYTIEESIGKPVWNFISEEYKPIVKMNLENRRQGISGSYELKLIRKDGSPIWTFLNAKPLFDQKGKYVGAMSMLTDIT